MTSSMSTGERRWASARRGGMTVLGKVAVPKPINLPSQRLENHGLDPSVEIVPKGTLSWGSKSSTSNAWGSSPLSPNTDCGTGSPSHLSGHASSGGSCTRPSTAGSDRTSEPIANAWGPNSRPSSASGVLTSNQTSLTSLRPCSAETRPGSSQLSRFAEPSSENSVAWAAAGTAEKLGLQSSKNDGFSLTSGDFPTLGSDHSSHGRPGSSSGSAAPAKERVETLEIGDVSENENGRNGAVNSWRRDNSQHSEDGIRPSAEKYQGEAQPYPRAGMHPQCYEPWHGPPANNPTGGVWYRGPPGGPPYGPPGTPGGFPMEPFPYYRPPNPASATINPQPVLPPGGVPRGHQPNPPKNGDMYRPHVPNAYIRPGMPIRPGFYPGPVSYDSYYGPPMGYCNSNERDIPFFGMAAGPSVYNNYPNQNASDPNNSKARSGGYNASCKTSASEHVDSGHPNDTRGPYKVLLKQHSSWDRKDEHKWDNSMTSDEKFREKSHQPRTPSNNDWETDHKQHEGMDPSKVAVDEEASQQASDNSGSSVSGSLIVKPHENMRSRMAFDDTSVKKVENAAATSLEVPQPVATSPKDSSLIMKIEGLNAKARAADGRHEVMLQRNKSMGNGNSANETSTVRIYPEKTHTRGIINSASRDLGVSTGDKSLESTTATGAVVHRYQGVQDKADHRGRGKRLDPQEFDGRRNRSPAADPSNIKPASELEEATGKFRSYSQRKGEEESAPPTGNQSDFQTQRAKMRELAQQRVKQLQKEEEERISKQMANAHAKLEELNRRSQAAEAKQEESPEESILVADKSVVSNPNVIAEVSGRTTKMDRSLVPSNEAPLQQSPFTAHKEHAVAHNNSTTLQPAPECKISEGSQQDVPNVEAAHHNNASNRYLGGASKLKRADYKPKQNIPSEKNPIKVVSTCRTEAPRHTDVPVHVTEHNEAAGNEFTLCQDTSLPVNPNVTTESLVHQRRKNNRNSKNKNKAEETASMVALAPSASKETKSSVESVKQNVLDSELDTSSVQTLTDFKDASHSSDHCSSFPNEEVHGRVNNLSKSHNSRRGSRNAQVGRLAERFHGENSVVWAPVRSQKKNEANDEARHGSIVETSIPSGKSDIVQNNSKNKRAEIERYVPKSVAKEMAHQGSIQQSQPPVKSAVPDETTRSSDSGIQGTQSTQFASAAMDRVGYALESRNGDGRQNKQEKPHGSQRQRGLTESRNAQYFQDGMSNTSNSSRNVQTSTEHQGTWNQDINSVKEQHIFYDETGAPDGWTIFPENAESAARVTVPVGKDQGVTGRGKRNAFKGHKGAGNNHDLDHKKRNSGDVDKFHAQSFAPPMIHTDLLATLKDNRGVGEHSSAHWQPKSQAFPASNRQGSRPNSGQNTRAEVGKANNKELNPEVVPLPQQEVKKTSEGMAQPHQVRSVIGRNNAEEAPDVGHQAARRERKTASHKARHDSPNQGSASAVEQAPSTDIQNEQHSSSGVLKNGNQNGRFGRGHESSRDWNSHIQDSKQNHNPANQERQRNNLHYEYQPVGPYNNKKSNMEGLRDGSHNSGPRFKERGQNQSRGGRGNFYSKQSGGVQVDAGYDY